MTRKSRLGIIVVVGVVRSSGNNRRRRTMVGQIHGKTGPTRLRQTLQEHPLVIVVVMVMVVVDVLLRRRIGEWKEQARGG